MQTQASEVKSVKYKSVRRRRRQIRKRFIEKPVIERKNKFYFQTCSKKIKHSVLFPRKLI
jgi:hypothetical protein